jgi:hypothetical protein
VTTAVAGSVAHIGTVFDVPVPDTSHSTGQARTSRPGRLRRIHRRGEVVVGYECGGCKFTVHDGPPRPTGSEGTPPDVEILALAPARPIDRDTTVQPIPEGRLSEAEWRPDATPVMRRPRVFGSSPGGTSRPAPRGARCRK